MTHSSPRLQIAEAITEITLLERLIAENTTAREILGKLRYFTCYRSMLNLLDRRALRGEELVEYVNRNHAGDAMRLGNELESWLAEFPEDGSPATSPTP